MKQSVVARVEEIAESVASSDGLEVVEVELKGSGRNHMVRVFIDKPDGVTHADCESVSLKMGDILDAEDLLPGHYTLEISSPGVERKLRKWKDFERFQGQRVKVVLREPLALVKSAVVQSAVSKSPVVKSPVVKSPVVKSEVVNGNAINSEDVKTKEVGVKHFEGVLQSAQDGDLKMELAGGQSVQFRFEQVDRANLKFEW